MPKPKVYLETTILGYLTPMRATAPDSIQSFRRQHAEEFWRVKESRFELYVSEVVLSEASKGRADLAGKRLQLLQDIPSLPLTAEIRDLAEDLQKSGIVPATAVEDALHIATASWWGMDFLVTYNFKHIDNPNVERHLEAVVARFDCSLPVLLSPLELLNLPA